MKEEISSDFVVPSITDRISKRKISMFYLAFNFLFLCSPFPTIIPVARAAVSPSSLPFVATATPELRPHRLIISGLLIIFSSAAMRYWFDLPNLSSRILKSTLRMSIQLLFIGSTILSYFFNYHNSNRFLVGLWILMIFGIAIREASSKIKYRYRFMEVDALISLMSGVGFMLLVTLYCILPSSTRPSHLIWEARTAIPMAGILVGNTLSALSLGLNSLLTEFADSSPASARTSMELRLARGATIKEASLPSIENAISTALTPKFNNMAAAGIILMPGTMTGQILGGASPITAAMYQVMIFCGISISSCITLFLLCTFVLRRMFWFQDKDDGDDMQRTRGLRALKSTEESTLAIKQVYKESKRSKNNGDESESISSKFSYKWVDERSACKNTERNSRGLSLHVNNLVIKRTNLAISFDIYPGDRIGITGPSGVGKTQLLRTIAKLEASNGGNVELYEGKNEDKNNMDHKVFHKIEDMVGDEWRTHIMWVSQDRSTLDGTPMTFYEEVKSYQTQKRKEITSQTGKQSPLPQEIGKDWNLPPDLFHQNWNTLSGGESQRIHLAIALSLQPDILLLDEPTSACDKLSTMAIEKTLMTDMNDIPIIIVSHDNQQIERICTTEISLE